jgi:hypothetical protein
MQVVINGLADSGWCANCAAYNTTYVLDHVEDDPVHGNCSWLYTFPSSPCNTDNYILLWRTEAGGNYFVQVDIDGDIALFDWDLNIGATKPNCNQGNTLSFKSGFRCDGSSSNAVVSSL